MFQLTQTTFFPLELWFANIFKILTSQPDSGQIFFLSKSQKFSRDRKRVLYPALFPIPVGAAQGLGRINVDLLLCWGIIAPQSSKETTHQPCFLCTGQQSSLPMLGDGKLPSKEMQQQGHSLCTPAGFSQFSLSVRVQVLTVANIEFCLLGTIKPQILNLNANRTEEVSTGWVLSWCTLAPTEFHWFYTS